MQKHPPNDTRRVEYKKALRLKNEFFLLLFCTFLILFFALVDDNVGWYLEHERNIYKLFPFISISIPFIMWQVSASFLLFWKKKNYSRTEKGKSFGSLYKILKSFEVSIAEHMCFSSLYTLLLILNFFQKLQI